MNTFTYNVIAATTPGSNGSEFSRSQGLTGVTNVTFDFSPLSSYDLTTDKKVNKIIVDLHEDGVEDITINRPLSGTTIQPISTVSFSHIFEPTFFDGEKRNIYFSVFRDDGEVDIVTLSLKLYHSPLSGYEDINLLKTDYFNDSLDDEKLLLTFINNNPENLGLSLMDIKPDYAVFNPALSGSQYQNTNTFNVGFTTNYILANASQSNTGPHIHIALSDIYDTNTGEVKNNGRISLKFRTRAPLPGMGTAAPEDVLVLNANPELFYVPLTANSGFTHLSGMITWNCGDLLKDIDLTTKTISIPLVDIIGTRTNLADFYFTSYNVGAGVSSSDNAVPDGGYFYVDLYDVQSCDTINTTTSTMTAFVNYGSSN